MKQDEKLQKAHAWAMGQLTYPESTELEDLENPQKAEYIQLRNGYVAGADATLPMSYPLSSHDVHNLRDDMKALERAHKQAISKVAKIAMISEPLLLISEARCKQIAKFGMDVAYDQANNPDGQLVDMAIAIASGGQYPMPMNATNTALNIKMLEKPYVDRLVIAGALIVAELERLEAKKKAWRTANAECKDIPIGGPEGKEHTLKGWVSLIDGSLICRAAFPYTLDWLYNMGYTLPQARIGSEGKQASQIAFAEARSAWVGWSHRAFHEFPIGYVLTDEEVRDFASGYTAGTAIETLEQSKDIASQFARYVA